MDMKSIIPLSIVLLMLLLGIWRIWYSGEATTIYARLAAWSLGFFEGLSVVWSIVCPIIVAVFLPPRPEIGLLRLFLYGEAVLIGICAFLALGLVFWHGRDTV